MLASMGVRGTITRFELIALVLLFLAVGWGATVLLRDIGSSPAVRNRQRWEDIRSLESALALYAIEHNGQYPEGVGNGKKIVCREGVLSCDDMLDLRVLVPRYLEHIPADPFASSVDETFYTVRRDGKNIVVAAPHAEDGEAIRVER